MFKYSKYMDKAFPRLPALVRHTNLYDFGGSINFAIMRHMNCKMKLTLSDVH